MGGVGGYEIVEKANLSDSENWNSIGLATIEDIYANPSQTELENNEELLSSLLTLQGNALIASDNFLELSAPRTENIEYIVQEGDTVSSIAFYFGISTNTILWANNLRENDYIRPGDKLVILPISGIQYKVKANDSVEAIAKKYYADADEIIAFNGIPADGTIKKGQDLIIPDGKIIMPKPQRRVLASSVSANTFTPKSSGKSITTYKGARHRFPYGYCTYYVATRYNIPWSGNAKSWLAKARAYGFATGNEPRVGSIVVTRESWWGHVAIVEKVYPNKIVISEMNHLSWAKKSVRVLSRSSRVIRGYIY